MSYLVRPSARPAAIRIGYVLDVGAVTPEAALAVRLAPGTFRVHPGCVVEARMFQKPASL